MDRQYLIDKINSVGDVSKDRNAIYEVLAELGISYKKTNCHKCLQDLLNIAKEELGLIGNAADESSFNDDFEYVYICDRAQTWNGHIINQNTPVKVIREFVKKFPKGYYKKEKLNKDNDMINIPNFIAEPNAVHTVVADAGVQPVPAGITGLQGIQGVQGVQDLQGIQGIQGIQDLQGITVPEENNHENENKEQETV